jgi:hypothetical protein
MHWHAPLTQVSWTGQVPPGQAGPASLLLPEEQAARKTSSAQAVSFAFIEVPLPKERSV